MLAERPATLDLALSHHPPAIMLSFGDATPFLPKVKRAGTLAICQVQSLAQARAVLIAGADIIVAQGTEAGGHGGRRSTLPLVPAGVDMIARSGRDVPLVAAGGIGDRRGLAAALMLGADGVLMGTRFYVASEALASSAAKARIVAASGDDTVRTSVFDIARGYDWPPQYTGRACIIASPKRGTGAKKRLRRTKLNARDMPRRQRTVTLISRSFSRARALTSYTRSSPHLSFSRRYSRRPRRRLHGPSP